MTVEDVVINIRSVQGVGTDEPEEMDFTTEGFYQFDDSDNTGSLTYFESEVTGLTGTRTTFVVLPECVVVDRDGLVTSRMVFKEGERNSFLYNTPYGEATMGVHTKKIEKSITADGGNVNIDYILDLEHAMFTRNRFSITIRKTGGQNSVEFNQ